MRGGDLQAIMQGLGLDCQQLASELGCEWRNLYDNQDPTQEVSPKLESQLTAFLHNESVDRHARLADAKTMAQRHGRAILLKFPKQGESARSSLLYLFDPEYGFTDDLYNATTDKIMLQLHVAGYHAEVKFADESAYLDFLDGRPSSRQMTRLWLIRQSKLVA